MDVVTSIVIGQAEFKSHRLWLAFNFDYHSLTMETERIGNSTLEQMGRQREQLQGANANIIRTKEAVMQASRLLTELGRKSFNNKMHLYAMVGVLIFANLWAFTRWLGKTDGGDE